MKSYFEGGKGNGREGKECLTVWVGCRLLISKDAISSWRAISSEGDIGSVLSG